jgi:hypothetical protein
MCAAGAVCPYVPNGMEAFKEPPPLAEPPPFESVPPRLLLRCSVAIVVLPLGFESWPEGSKRPAVA